MENILLTLVVVLLVLLLFMMGGLAVLGWRLLQKKNAAPTPPPLPQENAAPALPQSENERLHPEIRKRMQEAQALKVRLHAEATCHLHPKEPSEGACAICDQYFCKACLKSQQTLLFCREHIGIYLDAQWSEVHSVKSTPQNPEAGVEVVEWKKSTWEREALPMFIQTHYKINLDGDQIESWVVLFARQAEQDEIKKRVSSTFRRSPALNQ
jgi:hypothetical protein